MHAARRTGAAPVATLLAVIVAAVGFNLLDPGWIKKVGLDAWDMPGLRNDVESEEKSNRVLNEELEECHERMSMKEMLIEGLLQGKFTLREVTAEFLHINLNQPGYMILIRTMYAGANDAEKMARNVLEFAWSRMTAPFMERLWIAARLQAEFEEYIAECHADKHSSVQIMK